MTDKTLNKKHRDNSERQAENYGNTRTEEMTPRFRNEREE